MTKPFGGTHACCCSAPVAGIKLRPRQAQYFKTPANRSRAGFEPCGGSPARRTGHSALGLQRALGLGSYKTAWTWLHKLRRAMVRLRTRPALAGALRFDETVLSSALEEGVRGRQTDSESADCSSGRGRWRRHRTNSDAHDSERLRGQLDGSSVASRSNPAAVVHTDGWLGYREPPRKRRLESLTR